MNTIDQRFQLSTKWSNVTNSISLGKKATTAASSRAALLKSIDIMDDTVESVPSFPISIDLGDENKTQLRYVKDRWVFGK